MRRREAKQRRTRFEGSKERGRFQDRHPDDGFSETRFGIQDERQEMRGRPEQREETRRKARKRAEEKRPSYKIEALDNRGHDAERKGMRQLFEERR